ncbi:MFS transporter [Plantactinospora sonchi]|uniref:MFS transporter n=1 Tax=Plantactinospora sonchi TaxID=1544735 RepID=A0ABU7RRA4_9ACTN
MPTSAHRFSAPLVVLLSGSTLTVLAGAVLAPVLELLRADLDISPGAAGLLLTVHGLTLALVGPLVGWSMDRWGVRGPLAAGLVLYGVAGGAGLLGGPYPVLLAGRLVFGVGAAAVFTGTTLGLLDRYQGATRDRVMGWRSAAMSLGGVLWPLAGGALGEISWRAPFAVYLLGVPLGLATLRVLPRRPADAGRADRPPAGPATVPPRLLAVYGLQAVATMLLYGVLVFLPPRLAELGVNGSLRVAGFTATLSLAMTLTGLGYARARARVGDNRLLLLAFASWTIALAVVGGGDLPVLLLAASALFGVGMGLAVPALTVLVAEYAPDGRRGRATALLATATFASQAATPVLLGPVQTGTSLSGVFFATSAVSAVVLVLLLGRLRRPPTRHSTDDQQPAAG